MTRSKKIALIDALLNASEMIKYHVETGLDGDDIETDDFTFDEYESACQKAASIIDKIAKKYQKTL